MPAKPSGTAAHRLCPPPCVCRQAPPWCRRGWWRVGRRGKESRRTKASGALLHWASSMLYFSLKMNENLLFLRSTHGHEVDAAASKSHKMSAAACSLVSKFSADVCGSGRTDYLCRAPGSGPRGCSPSGLRGATTTTKPLIARMAPSSGLTDLFSGLLSSRAERPRPASKDTVSRISEDITRSTTFVPQFAVR